MNRESWLPTLKTDTPEEGYELAVKLARKAVGMTQPDEDVRKKLRVDYANNADSLTMASQVVALNFQTVAAANNYWTNN
ncbi:hexameric tyrosine-coordinated heme protein [Planococcus versutus]|uniref:Peroxidase n=1 Tax=Planococcus versutus TaxID=1302659 RepID=A0A1B1S4N3_9BACL|nr:hexameric tyrosine-coordinated heme protein [Planococcus versutus]ANU28146.1 peroxidase [Planococcus versutus]